MSEIPVPDTGMQVSRGSRNSLVNLAVVLFIIDALLGIFAAVVGYVRYENPISAFGLLLTIFALCIANGLRNLDPQAWMWANILAIVGIPLYALSVVPLVGIVLSILTLFYLNVPAVKQEFKQTGW